MSDFKKLRIETQRRLSDHQAVLIEQRATAGESLLAEGTLVGDYDSLLREEAEVAETIRTVADSRSRASEIRGRITELSERKHSAEAEHRRLTGDLDPLYAPIGERAFAVYRDNPLVDEEYAEVFAPLVEALETVRECRREVESLEAAVESKPFFEKVVVRGRLALARNRLGLGENRLAKLSAGAGKRIVATDFIVAIGDPSLDAVAAPYLERIDAVEAVEHDLTSVADEISRVQSELQEICDQRTAAACIAALEAELEKHTARRQQILSGIAAVAERVEDASFGPETTERLNACRATSTLIAQGAERLDRLDAAIEVERLEHELASIEESVARRQRQIEALTAEIATLEEKRSETGKRKKSEEKRRGSLENL